MINDLDISQWAYLLNPTFQFVNTAGKPLTDGWMEVYIHGLGDKYYCASDFNGTLHPFKIPLDSLGSNIVLADPDQAYDIYVYNKFGSLIMSRYNVSPVGAGGGSSVLNIVIKSEDGTVDVYSDGTGNFDLSIADTVDRVERLETLVSGVSGTSDYSIVHGTKDNSNFFLTDDGTDGINFTNDNYGWKLESGHIYQFNFNTKFDTGENNRYVSGKIYLEGPGTVGQEWQFDIDDSYIHSESINGSTVIVTPSNLAYYELKLKFDWNEDYESAPIVTLNKASIVDVTSIVNNTISGVSIYNAGTGIIIDESKTISVDTDLIPTVSAVSGMIDEAIANIPETATASLTLRTPTNKYGEYTNLGNYLPTGPNKTINIPKEVYTFFINSSDTYYNDVINAYLDNKEIIAIEIESWYASGQQYQNVYQNIAQKQYWGDTNFYNGGYVNFTRFDVDKNELVTWKCEPEYPGSITGRAKWTKTVTELGTGGLFIAEYNVTPYADIDAAFKSGKTVIVKRKDSPSSTITNYYQLCEYREYEQDPSYNAYYFSYLYGWSSEYIYCFPSNWGRSTFHLSTWEHVDNVVADAVSGLASEEYVDNAIASAASGLKEVCYIDYPTTPVSAITEAINNNQYPILKLGYDYIPLTVIGGNYYSFTGIIGGGQTGAGGYSVTANTDTNTWDTPQAINFATNEWTTELVSTVSGNIIDTVETVSGNIITEVSNVSGDLIQQINNVSGNIINTVETVSGDLHSEIISAINMASANKELFWVEYGSTSINDISTANSEGKSIKIHRWVGGDDYYGDLTNYGFGNYTFTLISDNGKSIYKANVAPDGSTGTWTWSGVNIPNAQVNSDWNAVSGISEILNKPEELEIIAGNNISISVSGNEMTISAADVDTSSFATHSEVNTVSGTLEGHIQTVSGALESEIQTVSGAIPSIAGLATETYVDNKVVSAINVATGMIPDVSEFATETEVYNSSITAIQTATAAIPQQVNADWNSNSGVSEILNKPQEAELIAGSGISIVASGNDYVISSTVTGGGQSYQEGYGIDITGDTIGVDSTVIPDMNTVSAIVRSATGSIPSTQVQSNWTEDDTSDPSYIQNKPTEKNLVAGNNITITATGTDVIISSTATGGGGGSYTAGDHIDITNDTISVTGITELVAGNAITITMNGDSAVISSTGEAQVQSDWNVYDSSSKAYIRNKPSIPAAQIQSDWNQTNTYSKDYIKNKPTIKNYTGASGVTIDDSTITLDEPLGIVAGSGINIVIEGDSAIVCCTATGGGGSIAQVNSDWNAVSGVAEILNKPIEANLLPGSGVTFGASGTDIVVNTTPIVLVNSLPATPISGVLYLIPEA